MDNGNYNDAGLDSSVKLMDELYVLCRNMDKRLQKHSSTGFLFGQGRLLSGLISLDGVSQSVLSKNTSLSPATVTEMLDKLEASGFVERKKDGQDSRKILVYITDRGRTAAKEMDSARSMAVSELFSVLTDYEILELNCLLSKLNCSLSGISPQTSKHQQTDETDKSSACAAGKSISAARPQKIRSGIRLR